MICFHVNIFNYSIVIRSYDEWLILQIFKIRQLDRTHMMLTLFGLRVMEEINKRRKVPLLHLLSRSDTEVALFAFWIWRIHPFQNTHLTKRWLVLLPWRTSLRNFFRYVPYKIEFLSHLTDNGIPNFYGSAIDISWSFLLNCFSS